MRELQKNMNELRKWKELGEFNHIKELVRAEKEGRLRIIKQPIEDTCGMCKHFIKGKGAFGRCNIREFKVNRRGQKTEDKFMPARSRIACRKGFERKEDI